MNIIFYLKSRTVTNTMDDFKKVITLSGKYKLPEMIKVYRLHKEESWILGYSSNDVCSITIGDEIFDYQKTTSGNHLCFSSVLNKITIFSKPEIMHFTGGLWKLTDDSFELFSYRYFDYVHDN